MDDNDTPNEASPESHEALHDDGGPKKLIRPRDGRVIAGVCAGVARHFEIDVTIVRVLWVLAVCLGFAGILAYLICWVVVPEE